MRLKLGLVTAALAGALASGCTSEARSESTTVSAEPAPLAVKTATAKVVETPETLELEGTLAANRQAKLSPLVAGHVSRVEVERGDVVKEGDALIVLRATNLQLQAGSARARAEAQRQQLGLEKGEEFDVDKVPAVVAAKSELDLAEDNLRRMTPLHASGSIDDRSFEQAKEAVNAAKARYVAAKNQATAGYASYRSLSADAAARADDANNTTLRAPFAGAVVERLVEVGEFVSPQQPVVELVDASKLRLELEVPERSVEEVAVGQTVDIRIDGTDQRLKGTVQFVAAAIDRERRTLTIEVLADNPESKVRAGHFARARIELGKKRKLVRVPSGAVQERAGVYRVYVVEDGRARARIVELVDSDDGAAFIRGNIDDGASIVAELSADVADGVPVKSSD